MPDQQDNAVVSPDPNSEDFTQYMAWVKSQETSGAGAETLAAESADESDTSDDSGGAEAEEAVEETADEASEAQDSEEEDREDDGEHAAEEVAEQPKGKKRGGFQKRIDKLTAKVRDLEAQLAGKPAEKAQPDTEAKPAAKPAEGKPKVEDFESYDDYVDALTDWKLAKVEKQKHEQTAQSTLQRSFAEARAAHADYAEVVEATEADLTPELHDAIMAHPSAGELVYRLAKQPDVVERLNDLRPEAIVRELGKLLAAPAASPAPAKPKPKPISSAPKPIQAPKRAQVAASKPDLYDEATANDFAAWVRVRNAQRR